MRGFRSAAGIRTLTELGKNKARLILMNKSDLADEEAGKLWSAYFQKKGYYVVSLDSRNRNGMKQVWRSSWRRARRKSSATESAAS